MREREIRGALRRALEDQHASAADTLVLDELGVCDGAARIDLAVVNGSLSGYEIKSPSDSLVRLPGQIAAYQRVFDLVTLVVSSVHVRQARSLIPRTWGLTLVEGSGSMPIFRVLRSAKPNRSVESESVCSLLWRDEALQALERLGAAQGYRGRSRRQLHAALGQLLAPQEVREVVREALKARGDWRADQRRGRDGDWSQPGAMSSRYPRCPSRQHIAR